MNLLKIKLFFFILIPVIGWSQADNNEDKLLLAGQVSNYFTEDEMTGVSVKITENGNYVNNIITDKKGKYEVFLEYDHQYVVLYEKADFVSKKIIINTKQVPPDKRDKLNDLYVEMTLFEKDKDLNVSFLNEPIGMAQYNASSNAIDWNMGYTAPISDKLNAILKDFVANKNTRAEAEKKAKEQYNEAMKDGDKYFFKKDYDNAKIAYRSGS